MDVGAELADFFICLFITFIQVQWWNPLLLTRAAVDSDKNGHNN